MVKVRSETNRLVQSRKSILDFSQVDHISGISRRELLRGGALAAAGSSLAGLTMPMHALSDAMLATGRTVTTERLAKYQIVVPAEPGAVEQQAAEKLQLYLQKMLGKSLPITKELEYRSGPAFLLGQTRFAASHGVASRDLKEDSFTLAPRGEILMIAGAGKGILYGVFALLESWGFRMYTSTAMEIPATHIVRFPAKAITVASPVKYRTTSYPDTSNPEYTAWHRLSSRSEWGLFVHTFNELVPPEKYAKTHPEYFSLVNGRRIPGTQLCLSNPEVFTILTANLKEKIAAKSGAVYWSVSQNDNDQYCHCDKCTALNAQYGNVPSGSILWFVNEVARSFPDKVISTLAYWYSRTPPQNIRPEPNVNIMLCNIESKRQAPVFETDPKFSDDLVKWGKLSNNILLWDYDIQFVNLVSPFPNLHTIKPNVKFFTDHGVSSLYLQADSQTGGEMCGLRAYLISKLMWDPAADDNALMNEYLNGYYGKAGPIIRHYIDTMRDSLISSGFQLEIFGSPEDARNAYLSAEMMQKYNAIFDQAEKMVADDPKLLTRVKVARLPIMYAAIQIGRNEPVDSARSMFAHASSGMVIAKPEYQVLVRQFVNGCKSDGVSRVRNRSTPPDDYQASYDRIFTKMAAMQSALSFGKQIRPVTMPEGGETTAQRHTDGIFGSYESWSAPDVNWIGYKGKHMDFVLDLGAIVEVQAVEMDFLNAQAQPDWNLLVLPKYVTYAFSSDGNTFGSEARVVNPHNPNPRENPGIASVAVQAFRADLDKRVKARYIKVHGESILQMPPWHIRAGYPASIYTDQIVVT
jgi:hypothetical protein